MSLSMGLQSRLTGGASGGAAGGDGSEYENNAVSTSYHDALHI